MIMKRTLIAFACLFVAAELVVFSALVFLLLKGTTNNTSSASNTVAVTDIGDLTELSFFNGIEELEFEKTDDVWYFKKDREFPVYQEYLKQFSEMVQVLSGVPVGSAAEGIENYNLDEATFWVKCRDENNKSIKILIGGRVGKNGCYVMVEGEDTIYRVPITIGAAADCQLYNIVEMETLPSIEPEQIKDIVITKRGETYKLKGHTKDWSWNEFAKGICALEFSDCVNYNVSEKQLDNYGLDEPTGRISYTYDNGSGEETVVLIIGSRDARGDYFYTMIEGTSAVNRISEALITPCLYNYIEKE